jgi:uncharacterized coiled-coil DUF342 family protein
MAKDMKKDATDLSIEEKLKNLYQLQTMLSEIDKIKTLRGELPLEVQDLEDEIEGLSTRIEKIHGEIGELNADIATRKANIEASKASIEKYSQQLDNALYFFRSRIEDAFSSKEYCGQTTYDRSHRGKNDSIFERLDVTFSFEQAQRQYLLLTENFPVWHAAVRHGNHECRTTPTQCLKCATEIFVSGNLGR